MKKEIGLTVLFILAIAILKFFFHEFWKDEWQSWLVSRDMPIFKLFSFLNYEGHPSLWYLYLKPFTWLSSIFKEDVLLNIAHIIPVAICTYLLFVKSSLPLLYKVLVALSYFFFFEYGVINRGYSLVILFTFLSAFAILEKRTLLLTASLFLLCQTEVYGVILACSLLLFYFYKNKFNEIKPLISVLLGVLTFIISVFPRGNSEDFTRAYNSDPFDLTSIANSIQGLLANTFAIGLIPDTASYGYSTFGLLLSIILFSTFIYLVFEHKAVRNVFLFGIVGLILFSIFIYSGGVRQWGFMYLLFITILILEPKIYEPEIKYWLITILLLPPVFHNIKAVPLDYKINFSNAKDAGQFIKDKIPENVAIVSLNKFETAGAAAYAGRKMFELPSGTPFTYFKWLEKVYIPSQSELMLFAKYKHAKGLVILSPTPVDVKRYPILKLWEKFEKENFKSEEFYFYILNLSGRN